MDSLASHLNRAVPTRSELLGHVYKINKRVSFFCHEFLFMLLSCHFTEILMVKNKLFLVYCLGLEICRSSVSSLASCCSYIVVKEKNTQIPLLIGYILFPLISLDLITIVPQRKNLQTPSSHLNCAASTRFNLLRCF